MAKRKPNTEPSAYDKLWLKAVKDYGSARANELYPLRSPDTD